LPAFKWRNTVTVTCHGPESIKIEREAKMKESRRGKSKRKTARKRSFSNKRRRNY